MANNVDSFGDRDVQRFKGSLLTPETNNTYINLSDSPIDPEFHKLLSLGYKCHYKPKFDPLIKQLELEVLYSKLLTLQNQAILNIHDNQADQPRAEATKNRDFSHSNIINRDILLTAKNLKNHPDLIVQRADKSNIFVILNRTDYKIKLDSILADTNKFKIITRNPILTLKTTLNKYIATINKNLPEKILQHITGEFSPGYLYGTVKKS